MRLHWEPDDRSLLTYASPASDLSIISAVLHSGPHQFPTEKTTLPHVKEDRLQQAIANKARMIAARKFLYNVTILFALLARIAAFRWVIAESWFWWTRKPFIPEKTRRLWSFYVDTKTQIFFCEVANAPYCSIWVGEAPIAYGFFLCCRTKP